MSFEELQGLNIFTKEEFETRLNAVYDDLVLRSKGASSTIGSSSWLRRSRRQPSARTSWPSW